MGDFGVRRPLEAPFFRLRHRLGLFFNLIFNHFNNFSSAILHDGFDVSIFVGKKTNRKLPRIFSSFGRFLRPFLRLVLFAEGSRGNSV